MPIKAILIDISDTLVSNGSYVPGAQAMLARLAVMDADIYYVSNNRYELADVPADKVLSPAVVGGRKGTGKFVEYVSNRHCLERHEMIYIGDTDQDMWEAKNGGVLLFSAGWSQSSDKTQYGFCISSGYRLGRTIPWLFRPRSLWYFSLSDVDPVGHTYTYRAVLDATTAKNTGVTKFLKQGENRVMEPDKGSADVRRTLFAYLLATCQMDGLFKKDANGKRPLVCVYPGHTGDYSPRLVSFLSTLAKLNYVEFCGDLIIRFAETEKGAFRRWKEKPVLLETQLQSIKLNADYREKIMGRKIIVFDDFTTEGFSFETARNWLYNAGASEVVCVAFGKYGLQVTGIAYPAQATTWDSFAENPGLTDDDFVTNRVRGNIDAAASGAFGPLPFD